MKIGYARISTVKQHDYRQIDALVSAGIDLEHIYVDKITGSTFDRPQYKAMLKALRAGDTLVVKEIDRFGRSYEEIREEFKQITDRGIYINVLDTPMLNTDQEIAQGLTMKFISDLVLAVLGYVAQTEKEKTHQRQAEGIRSAKARGKKFGRPTLDPEKLAKAQNLVKEGTSVREACRQAQISYKAYYNYMNKDRAL